MSFAGGLGLKLDATQVSHDLSDDDANVAASILFAESNSRFLCEVAPEHCSNFEKLMGDLASEIGEVIDNDQLEILMGKQTLLAASLSDMKTAWQTPLKW